MTAITAYRLFLAAARALPLFERQFPDDRRPRAALEAVLRCLRMGEEDVLAAAAAAHAAAAAAGAAATFAASAAADAYYRGGGGRGGRAAAAAFDAASESAFVARAAAQAVGAVETTAEAAFRTWFKELASVLLALPPKQCAEFGEACALIQPPPP